MYMLFQRGGASERRGEVAEHVAMPQQLISVLLQDCRQNTRSFDSAKAKRPEFETWQGHSFLSLRDSNQSGLGDQPASYTKR
jgi:hypothetical protein